MFMSYKQEDKLFSSLSERRFLFKKFEGEVDLRKKKIIPTSSEVGMNKIFVYKPLMMCLHDITPIL